MKPKPLPIVTLSQALDHVRASSHRHPTAHHEQTNTFLVRVPKRRGRGGYVTAFRGIQHPKIADLPPEGWVVVR